MVYITSSFLPLWSNERPTTRSLTVAITPLVNGLAVVRLSQPRFSEDNLSLLYSFGETLPFPILSELTPASLASQAPISSRRIRIKSWFPTSTPFGRLFFLFLKPDGRSRLVPPSSRAPMLPTTRQHYRRFLGSVHPLLFP